MSAARLLRFIIALPAVGLSSALAVPPDQVDHSLRKICQRGAAVSAAEYCQAQLVVYAQNSPQRSRWAMRYLECLCQSALQSPSESQSEANWAAIAQAESEYRRDHPADPRLPWLAWQLARGDLLRAQQALAKWLAAPAAQNQREQALQAVRRVQSRMDAVEKDIKERLPLSQARSATSGDQATSRELQELQIDCASLRCEALLARARCYEVDSPDHLAALADVERTATAVLTQSAQDWAARSELIVAQATAGLELGKRPSAMSSLQSILHGKSIESGLGTAGTAAPEVSTLARLRAGSALVEALCNAGQAAEAQPYLDILRQSFDDPEVELCQLRVNLAGLEKLSAAERGLQLKAAVELANSLGQRYGNYWRNRGEALLVAAAARAGIGGSGEREPGSAESSLASSELLTVEIRQLLSGGQTAAAIVRLQQAVQQAQQAQQFAESLQYAIEAAKLMQKEKQWQAAADLLLPVTTSQPQLPQAAAAHVLAAWCLAQSLSQNSPSPELKAQYEAALQEQLTLWPDAQESLKAESYLSSWLAGQKRYADLAIMWSRRAATLGDPARQQVAIDNWLDTVVAGLPQAQALPEAQRFATEVSDGQLDRCRDAAAIAGLAAAMLTCPLTQAEAEALTGLKMPGQHLAQAAASRNLLAVLQALAAARRQDAADAHSSVGFVDHERLSAVVNLAWCRSLAEALDEVSPAQVANWRPVFELVRMPKEESKLTPVLQMTQLRLEQLSSAEPSEQEAALKRIRQLASQHVNDPQLQLTLAAAVAQAGSSAGLSEAIRLIKRVAAGTNRQSQAYLRARWIEIQWNRGRGDAAAASEIAKLALAKGTLQPEWWRRRFEAAAQGK